MKKLAMLGLVAISGTVLTLAGCTSMEKDGMSMKDDMHPSGCTCSACAMK